MNIVASREPVVQDVQVTDDEIIATLADGRVISVPLAWSWRLSEATPAQRANWRLSGSGQGVHWPDIDEDLSAEGLLHGVPAYRPPSVAAEPKGSRRQPAKKHVQAGRTSTLPRRGSNRTTEKPR
ncbi:MAG: DUF2442 domain-containing protein [Acidobacteriota bacterium]